MRKNTAVEPAEHLPGVPPQAFKEWGEDEERLRPSDPYEAMFQEADAEIEKDHIRSSFNVHTSDPYEDILRQADAEIARDYRAMMDLAGAEGPSGVVNSHAYKSKSSDPPTSCVICFEDCDEDVGKVHLISRACFHTSNSCYDCVAAHIKMELENKIWNRISCPECEAQLLYDDIKRLADPDTFARYHAISLRHAIGSDPSFRWCKHCDFGQLHKSGASQPIVCCLKCKHESCFTHSVSWHEGLSCGQYDRLVRNPDDAEDVEDEDEVEEDSATLQDSETRRHGSSAFFARSTMMGKQLMHEEEDRQKIVHEEQQEIARKIQNVKIERMIEEQRRAKETQKADSRAILEKERRARERQEAEAAQRRLEEQEWKERERQYEEIKRKAHENRMSTQEVKKTTKPCPGCRFDIEHTGGCAHMICSQCRYNFCWACLRDWHGHGPACPRPIRSRGIFG